MPESERNTCRFRSLLRPHTQRSHHHRFDWFRRRLWDSASCSGPPSPYPDANARRAGARTHRTADAVPYFLTVRQAYGGLTTETAEYSFSLPKSQMGHTDGGAMIFIGPNWTRLAFSSMAQASGENCWASSVT